MSALLDWPRQCRAEFVGVATGLSSQCGSLGEGGFSLPVMHAAAQSLSASFSTVAAAVSALAGSARISGACAPLRASSVRDLGEADLITERAGTTGSLGVLGGACIGRVDGEGGLGGWRGETACPTGALGCMAAAAFLAATASLVEPELERLRSATAAAAEPAGGLPLARRLPELTPGLGGPFRGVSGRTPEAFAHNNAAASDRPSLPTAIGENSISQGHAT